MWWLCWLNVQLTRLDFYSYYIDGYACAPYDIPLLNIFIALAWLFWQKNRDFLVLNFSFSKLLSVTPKCNAWLHRWPSVILYNVYSKFFPKLFFVRHMYSVFYDHVKLLALYSDVSKQNNIYHYHSLLWFCWDHSPLFDVIWIFATRPCRWRHCVFVCLSTMFVRTDIVTTILHERLRQSRWNLQGITINPYWWPGWILEVKVTAGCRGGEGMHVDAGKLKSFYFVIAQVPKTNFCTKAHHKKLLCLK